MLKMNTALIHLKRWGTISNSNDYLFTKERQFNIPIKNDSIYGQAFFWNKGEGFWKAWIYSVEDKLFESFPK